MSDEAYLGQQWTDRIGNMTARATVVVDLRIRQGMRVECRTADDRWIEKTAVSPVLSGYKWPCVLVTDGTYAYGWPADDVRPASTDRSTEPHDR